MSTFFALIAGAFFSASFIVPMGWKYALTIGISVAALTAMKILGR